jgi:NitT/TauT family transport system permease protein
MPHDTAVVEPVAESEAPVRPPDMRSARLRRGRGRGRKVLGINLVRLAVVAVWLGSWELACRTVVDPFFYSMPSKIWQQLVTWFTDGTAQGSIWSNMAATFEEAVLGFVLGTIGGVVLGVLLGRANYLAEVVAPFIKMANAIPRIVLASLFVIWFGLGMESKVATAFVLVFFAVFFNAFQGAREVDRVLVDNARILGAGRLDMLRTIILPSATSWITSSMHVAFGFALIGAVVGEYTGADKGMGLLINTAQGNFNAAGIYAGMVVVTVMALVAEGLISRLERRLTAWQPRHTGAAVAAI